MGAYTFTVTIEGTGLAPKTINIKCGPAVASKTKVQGWTNGQKSVVGTAVNFTLITVDKQGNERNEATAKDFTAAGLAKSMVTLTAATGSCAMHSWYATSASPSRSRRARVAPR